MADSIKFYFDQHIHAAIASSLETHGIDVLTAQDAGRCGMSDADQLQFAEANRRVLVTHDTDYLVLASTGVPHAGIAWFHATKYSIGQAIQMLLLLHQVLEQDDMVNRVEYL